MVPVRICACPVCGALAAVHLLETGREGHALAVLRGLPGAVAVALEVAREEGRRVGVEDMRNALMHGAPGEAGRPARKPARRSVKKARQAATPTS